MCGIICVSTLLVMLLFVVAHNVCVLTCFFISLFGVAHKMCGSFVCRPGFVI